jgi:hypothetical protein
MRLLTVRQPWAEAIADGAKLTENRSQGFPKGYRGLLGIHAGLGWSERAVWDERIRALWHDQHGARHPSPPALADRGHANACDYAIRHVPAYHGRPPHPFQAGVVLALAELVDVHPAAGCCAPWGEDSYPPANPEARPPGQVTHLVLDNVRRIRPVPAKGRLGLWRPDDDLAIELAHRLAELVTWDQAAAERVADRGDVAQLWAVVRDDDSLVTPG